MIPNARSGEEHQDSEATIAVNPANPLQIAGSAFTPDPGGGRRAPVYVSTDGGLTWILNSIVPGNDPDLGTNDITLQFSQTGNVLYAGTLRPTSGENTRLNILRARDVTKPDAMEVLVDRRTGGIDQPYVKVVTVSSGRDAGKDRLYVGDNYSTLQSGRTATIDQSLDARAARPHFTSVRIESRDTAGQDGPPIRPAVHPDGTVYAVFHAWRSFNDRTGIGVADVVVVRDDAGGTGRRAYADLVDPVDGQRGIRVVQRTDFNFNGTLGKQRTGGDVAIAVDPTDSSTVYVAYNADRERDYVLHVVRSTDRGRTWSADVETVIDGLNPGLAINSDGMVGLVYQQLTGSGAAQRWITKLQLMDKNATAWTTRVLATTAASTPQIVFDPYLGDYGYLTAVGRDFYGVFCANNTPRRANFPQGVRYQRNANFATGTLLDVDNRTPVHASIDPFFFKVTL
jgi:hypothetical protein